MLISCKVIRAPTPLHGAPGSLFFRTMPPTKTYTKTALSTTDLLTHLQSKGLNIPVPAAAIGSLERIGYYRLLIYMRPLQDATRRFVAGKSFDDILELYEFDRKLRLLCLDAIERIEVGLRSAIIQKLAVPFGPHFYLDPAHYGYSAGLNNFLDEVRKSKYLGVTHYRNTYATPTEPPIWTVLEAVTLGTISYLYADLVRADRKLVATAFGYDERVLVSWFKTLTVLRNMCAHHNRLWNFSFMVNQPILAHSLAGVFSGGATFHTRAVILVDLLNKVAPGSDWKAKLISLIQATPGRASQMGFPAGWEEQPFWL